MELLYSDIIGTKPLNRTRMLVLLNQVDAIEPISMRMVGQEEFEALSERLVSQQNPKKIAKTILRMTAMMGLEPLVSVGAAATEFSESSESCELAVGTPRCHGHL